MCGNTPTWIERSGSAHLESWLPPRIFDAHTHVNEPRFQLAEMTDQKRRQYWVNEVAEPIGAADAARCYQIVFPGREVSCLVFGFPFLDFDIEGSNASLQPRVCPARLVSPGRGGAAVVGRARHLRLDMPNTLGVKVYYAMISHDPLTRDKHLEASIFDFLPIINSSC